MQRVGNERGIALAIAIFALVVIGGLVAGAMFVATQEQRVGRSTLRQRAAFDAAEAGVQEAALNWDPGYDSLQTGGRVAARGAAPDARGWYERSIQRLGRTVFLVRADGFDRDSMARSRVGLLLKLEPLTFNINAALKTRGALTIDGSSYIDGNDAQPVGWTGCPALQPALPGMRIPDPAELTAAGCGSLRCVDGNPRVQQDATGAAAMLTTVGGTPFDSLEGYAAKVVGAGSTNRPSPAAAGSCNTADPYNWGDPLTPSAACGGYFPVVWAEGDIHVTGGQGQGVLIVNGNLTVTGGFQFFGPVLVRGMLSTRGAGGQFKGGVIAEDVDLEQAGVLGAAAIGYSSCALHKAMIFGATVSTLRQRSWVDLY